MLDHIFREYDIRGIVGTELSIDNVYDLTRAIAYYFKQQKPYTKTVVIGMDGRIHSPAIKDEVVRGFHDSDMDVVFIGICPTPIMYFSLHTLSVHAGVMITASHNPAEYNGIKICLDKESVFGTRIKDIRALYKNKQHCTKTKPGAYTEVDAVSSYVSWLADHFACLNNMNLSVLVDCGNAVGGIVMPKLIKALAWKNVTLLYPEIDGTYPHHEADPTVEKNMLDLKQHLACGTYDLGIGFDGDCDRMAAMTTSGYLVPGDQLLAVFSKSILQQYPGTSVVFDVKASSALIEVIQQHNGIPRFSACGHALIKNKMKETGALLGGELSCHFCFKDKYFGFDDGIYAALRLFEIIILSGQSLDELIAIYPKTSFSPEFRIACSEEKKHTIVQSVKEVFAARDDAQLITIDGVRAVVPYGWGLLRSSNTQPVISMRFESTTDEGLKKIKHDFITALQPFFDEALLIKQLDG